MKKILIFVLAIIMTFSINVYAVVNDNNSSFDDEVSVLSDNQFEAKGEIDIKSNIKISKPVTGSGVYFGESITVNSTINGVAILMGEQIDILGDVEYGVLFGSTININGKILNDAFIAGENVSLLNGELVRDTYITAQKLYINGKVGRDLNFSGQKIIIKNGSEITGNLWIDAQEIVIEENVNISGKIKHRINAKLDIFNSNQYEIETFNVNNYFMGRRILNISTSIINTTLSQIFVFLVGMLLFPKLFKRIPKIYSNGKEIGSGLLTGLVTAIILPVAAIFLVVLPFTRGLSFISIASLIIMIYLSMIIVGVMVGELIQKNIKKELNPYLRGAIGIFIVKMLCIIPGLFIFPVLLGVGSMVKLLAPYAKAKK